ncbi:uncharacterized protein LOC106162462 [Lingula anatina]|uniref:Uncharacterized protein LOC106162462 n=1 Tax=Lingula anatina TaxID=7574 RepID=A0A1S3ICR5_LINAN|nr:uncharacterized protein LOC106162462 [Lingula anatina]|eukprot:XP_013395224.1 uncharacterized protein LOC106162462 [Lingula anatina]
MSAMLDKNGGGGMGHSPRPTYSSYDGYTRSNYSSLKDEINRFSEEKKKQIEMEDPEVNKKKLKEQLDAEINSRVREALDTPPLERIQRNRNKADKEDVDHISQLNAQIMMDLTDKERDYVNSRHWREMQKRRLKNLRRSASEGSGFQKKTSPRLEGELSRSNQDDFPGVLGLDRMPNQAPSLGRWARLENFGIMSQPPKPPKIFSTCTREGYLEALRNGRFPDGSKLTLLHNGKFADKYGVVRDEHGPFWPPDYGPLFPTPKHILAVPATPEYLMTEISASLIVLYCLKGTSTAIRVEQASSCSTDGVILETNVVFCHNNKSCFLQLSPSSP